MSCPDRTGAGRAARTLVPGPDDQRHSHRGGDARTVGSMVRTGPERKSTRRARRVAALYGAGAVVLVGWAAYLGVSLPDRDLARHWNAAWVGLDALIVFSLALTARLAARRDRRVAIPASATAALLVADAWMDVTTAGRADRGLAILLAVVVELPLAALSFALARRSLRRPARLASRAGAVEQASAARPRVAGREAIARPRVPRVAGPRGQRSLHRYRRGGRT